MTLATFFGLLLEAEWAIADIADGYGMSVCRVQRILRNG